ncbi:sensor histidine kinase [Yinghuangia seranimata]|uniref:sensor histidine kinase n=1 Tax=Yinghuangia seranimata TaxID=408067 RepID=UPI00248C07BF|nr:HAMP domain-containing sensor histidine kinase [Yinghuangia seranimata]MDI2124884.1 HAMP domain-containing sensor histidine kinase [Yinghuangia seranimata]
MSGGTDKAATAAGAGAGVGGRDGARGARWWHRLPPYTLRIRTRLALLHAGLFVLCGAALLIVQYIAVTRILGDHSAVVTTVPANTATLPTAPDYEQMQPVVPAQPAPGMSGSSPAQPLTPIQIAQAATVATARFVSFKSVVLDSLVGQSLITLGLLTVVAAALGWWTAGRSVARLHAVTVAARQISERNLHDRLALVGPQDEIKELGDTIDAMLGRLDRAFAANRRFAANASHELRTPLALQRTALEIPLAEGRVPDDLKPSIERALRATERSERLVGSLLLLSKGQQGPESYRETDLAALADEAVDMYRAQAAAAGVVVTTDLVQARTSGDPVLLEQVAVNLVQNAVRHNTPGADGRGYLQVSTSTTAHGAELRVLNSGPKLEAASVEQLFEPFHRGEAARLAGPGAGAGLGLSIVRAVVDSHGGTVTAEARAEGGLVVTVLLPRTP